MARHVLPDPQKHDLRDALVASYSRARLADVLLKIGRRQYEHIELPHEDLLVNFLEVIKVAERENWLMELLAATRERDPRIQRAYEALTAVEAKAGAHADPTVVVAFSCTASGEEMAAELAWHLKHTGAPVRPWRGSGYKLRRSDILLLIATEDAVRPTSPCRAEVEEALAMGLAVIAVMRDASADRPGWTRGLDAVDGRDGWVELGKRLQRASVPARRLQALQSRAGAIRRARDHAQGPEAKRLDADVADLEQLIAVLDPRLSGREGTGGTATPGDDDRTEQAGRGKLRCVGTLPVLPDGEFHDRVPYLDEIVRLLTETDARMVALTGPAGIGKTALIAKLRAGLESPSRRWPLHGFVYLPVFGFRPVSAASLVTAVVRMIPDEDVWRRLNATAKRGVPWRDILGRALEDLAGCPVLVVIDNADDLLDGDGRFEDEELRDVVDLLLARRDHEVRLLLVGQPDVVPAGSVPLALDQGLREEFARGFLLAMDADELLRLQAVPEDEVNYLCRLFHGSPRALELAYALLSEVSDQPVAKLVERLQRSTGDVVEFALNEAFDRLNAEDRQILQILAVYGRPVVPDAVDDLLRRYMPDAASAWRLIRLHRLRLVRRDDDGKYYVPPRQDRLVLAKRVQDGAGRFTWIELSHFAAEYFARQAAARSDIATIDDLTDHLAEIDLRIQAEEPTAALGLTIDVNERYLMPWSYSSVAVHMLAKLPDRLADHQKRRRHCALAWAYSRQRRPDQAVEHANAALALRPRRRTRARLLVTLGNGYFEQGRLDCAAAHYRLALRTIPAWLVRHGAPIRANALVGLASVLAKTGDFEDALSLYEKVTRLLPRRPDPSDKEAAQLGVAVAGNRSILHTKLKDYAAARRHLDDAVRMARAATLNFEIGECHVIHAQLLVTQGKTAEAVVPAGEAAAIAAETGNRRLGRDAQELLALALLGERRLKEAADAIRVAVRHDPTAGGLALQGTIAYRDGDSAAAAVAFENALALLPDDASAESLGYDALDERGLILTGLAAARETPDLFREATAAFRAARKMTSAGGVVDRVALLFNLLGPPGAEEVRAAATLVS